MTVNDSLSLRVLVKILVMRKSWCFTERMVLNSSAFRYNCNTEQTIFPTVGVNCMYDPMMTLKTMKIMKQALDSHDLTPFLMTQPNGFHCPGTGKKGYLACPEYPYGEYLNELKYPYGEFLASHDCPVSEYLTFPMISSWFKIL